jgi:hypothetical protein
MGVLTVQLSLDQVTEMAPDDNSAAAGKKLMAPKSWEEAERSPDALWGLCRGSKIYQVKVDLSNLGYNCSCPSRKLPCKHVLGLLMLWAASPDAVSEAAAPDWVADWLERRKQKEAKKAERQEATAASRRPADEKAQRRRAAQRESRVSDGLARLDVWLRDLVRNGLAAVETKPPSFWDDQAKRLVDAQAPGLASRVARLGALPGPSRDWPERLLAELGRLKLLVHAWGRIGELDAEVQTDVRQILGWTIDQEELQREGERVDDAWAVIGQWVDDEDRVRAQRSWLVGRETNRTALVLQFAASGQAFTESIVPGSEQRGALAFYPGAARQRAKFLARDGNVVPLAGRPPGAATIDDFFATVAQQVARGPWLSSFGTMLYDVTLFLHGDTWMVCDRCGRSMPLRGRDHWKMLAVTGGHPFDLAGEWDGYCLRPLGLYVEETYRVA